MMPPEPKRGGRKGGGQSVSFNLPGPIAQQAAPAPRKLASEYQPPSSFVQQMERPQTEKSKNVLDDLWQFS
jgi:hypothetical protein